MDFWFTDEMFPSEKLPAEVALHIAHHTTVMQQLGILTLKQVIWTNLQRNTSTNFIWSWWWHHKHYSFIIIFKWQQSDTWYFLLEKWVKHLISYQQSGKLIFFWLTNRLMGRLWDQPWIHRTLKCILLNLVWEILQRRIKALILRCRLLKHIFNTLRKLSGKEDEVPSPAASLLSDMRELYMLS